MKCLGEAYSEDNANANKEEVLNWAQSWVTSAGANKLSISKTEDSNGFLHIKQEYPVHGDEVYQS
jgi:aminopeptidase N